MAEAQTGTWPWRRLAVTLLSPLAVALVARWPLPGMHLEALERLDAGFDPTMYGLFRFGLNPVLSAFLLVEIAALIVPRWRPLRHGGPEARARLRRRVAPIALVLVSIQSFFIYRWMQGNARVYPPAMSFNPDSTAGWLVTIAGPIAGSMLLLWLADLISEHGLANGISVLLAGTAIPELAHQVISSLRARLLNPDEARTLAPLVLTGMVVVALAVSTARRPARGWRQRPPRPALPVPASALMPVTVCFWLAALPGQLTAFIGNPGLQALAGSLAPGSLLQAAVLFPLLALLAVAFAWLLARPALVVTPWQAGLRALAESAERDGDQPSDDAAGADPDAAALARAAFRRALWPTLAFVGALTFVAWLGAGVKLVVDLGMLLAVACVALDVAAELRFRRAHAGVASVTAEHRLYAVGPALAVLSAAGIAHVPRALRHRALLAFWGPYLPIEILVPRSRADEARALLAQEASPRGGTRQT